MKKIITLIGAALLLTACRNFGCSAEHDEAYYKRYDALTAQLTERVTKIDAAVYTMSRMYFMASYRSMHNTYYMEMAWQEQAKATAALQDHLDHPHAICSINH